jgi:ATP-dependent DNA helicase RecG
MATRGETPALSGITPNIGEAAMRLARTRAWDADVSRLRFARGARAESLERIGMRTVRDVLLHVPHRYLDFTNVTKIAWADMGAECTVVGTVDKVTLKKPRPRMQIVEVMLLDDSGVLRCSFFKQPWLAEQLHQGDTLAVSGKVSFAYGFKQMTPQFHEVVAREGEAQGQAGFARLLPVHGVTEGLSAAWMRRIASAAVADWGDAADFMPAALVAKNGLMGEARAIREAHFPASKPAAERARRRLAYDELMCLQAALLARREIELAGVTAHVHVTDGPRKQALLAAMPFALTGEQTAAVEEILADMASERPMNRLLLGDVGTGKTAVAAVALAAVADSASQAAVMAPTSVLARQYAEKLGPLFDAAGISWALVTGATSPVEREDISARLATGELCVLFGTTAVLGDDMAFRDLSLVVVDEQHRFGVNQRGRLRSKGTAPDQLTMTATPIPRTLALSVYGDLACSRIRERPHAGAGVTTKLLTTENADVAHTAIAEAVAAGHQAYVICPLVDEADDGSELDDVPEELSRADAKPHSAQATYERLRSRVFKDANVGLLTGRMSAAEKDEAMAAFREGRTQVLVSTTVVEVGVDVPNATVMMIWDADRFGLATLHQLRGRVGRGKDAGTVYLVSAARGNSPARRRLNALARTSDGLELAETDLRLRHEGEVLGYRQSGGVTLTLVDLVADADLVAAAHEDALALVEADPALSGARNRPLAREVRRRFGAYFEGERSR